MTGQGMDDVCGVPMSVGTVSQSEQATTQVLDPPGEEARACVEAQEVAHLDATSWRRNRSGCENRNHAAACDFWALLGSRDGAASPRKAASCAAVRYESREMLGAMP